MLVPRRVKSATWITAALCVALPASASGAATIGQTFAPDPAVCDADGTYLTSGSPAGQHAAPSSGVITSFSFRTGATPPQIRFKVLRPAGGNSFTAIADSAAETTVANTVNTFDTRLPAATGDVIGIYTITAGQCLGTPATTAGWSANNTGGDVPPGGPPQSFSLFPNTAYNVSAKLEPDADGDGFGDETQDQCSTDASTQGQCAPPPPAPADTDPPDTEITKTPANKSSKSKAKYKFTSDDPSATFECSLKGPDLDQAVKQFGDCDSPRKYKGLDEGKFKFKVRAVDAAGNTDASPAKDKFKVVG